MNPRLPVAIAILLLALHASADPTVYKCTTAAGKVEYRDRSCDSGMASQRVNAYENTIGTGEDLASIRARDAEFKARQDARRAAAAQAEAADLAARRRGYEEERAHRDRQALVDAVRESNAQRQADEYYYRQNLRTQPPAEIQPRPPAPYKPPPSVPATRKKDP